MYLTAWFCKNCDHEMTFSVKMGSYGRCPYCGNKGINACTIIDTYEKAYKLKKINPIWMFWKKTFEREYLEG